MQANQGVVYSLQRSPNNGTIPNKIKETGFMKTGLFVSEIND